MAKGKNKKISSYTSATKSANKERKQKRYQKFLTDVITGKYKRLKKRLNYFGYKEDVENKSIKELRKVLHPFVVDKKKKENYKHWHTEMRKKLKGLFN
jgi:uncharacterized membrane protein